MDYDQIRELLLEIMSKYSGTSSLQPLTVLNEARVALGPELNIELEQAVLTIFYDFFRNGQIAWGFDLGNPEPPFCHVTELGRKTLENLSRDPANPAGYTKYLNQSCALNSVAQSYLAEALKSYNSDCFKAAAVMTGVAAESILLELRDELVGKIRRMGQAPPEDIRDWRIKQVFDSLTRIMDGKKNLLPKNLKESYESFWYAFGGQIRMARNEAGHPTSVDAVTSDTVHSSLLIFPELAKLVYGLKSWMSTSYS